MKDLPTLHDIILIKMRVCPGYACVNVSQNKFNAYKKEINGKKVVMFVNKFKFTKTYFRAIYKDIFNDLLLNSITTVIFLLMTKKELFF